MLANCSVTKLRSVSILHSSEVTTHSNKQRKEMICLKANSQFCCLYTENWIWLSSYHHSSFISWRKAALFWVLPETHNAVAMSSALRLKQRNCNKYQSANMSGRRHEPEMAFILAKPQGEWIFKFTSKSKQNNCGFVKWLQGLHVCTPGHRAAQIILCAGQPR